MRRAPIRLLSLLVCAVAIAPPATCAAAIDILQRIDLAPIVGPVPPGYQVAAIAHDGQHLWLVHPAGDRLLEIEPSQGALVSTRPLVGHRVVQPAGMTFGDGQLWLLDTGAKLLLRVGRDGVVTGRTSLAMLEGTPFGIDFRPRGDAGRGVLYVAIRGFAPVPDRFVGFRVEGAGVVLSGHELEGLVQGVVGIATTSPDGVPYTFLSAARSDTRHPYGDGAVGDDPQKPPLPPEIAPPDDSIPRGGMDFRSSHRLVMVDSKRWQPIWEVYAPGPPAADLAASGSTLFYPTGTSVLLLQLIWDTEVEYGACAIRDLEFFRRDSYDGMPDMSINFATPYDRNFGAPNPQFYEDGTGGYTAQDLLDWLLIEPYDGIRHSEYTQVGSSWLVRQGLHFPFQYRPNPSARYPVRMKVCSASYNVRPDLVGRAASIPDDAREMYSYDADNDGYGDDNPQTCIDDYFQLDNPALLAHLNASGAMTESNLYWRVRAIHRYVTSRHVYSGADGHWSQSWCTPTQKLDSPYATCSSAAFMVAALARKAGIPARLVGTSIQRKANLLPGEKTKDEDFHRWAQVYLPPYGWLRVDSTPPGPGSIGFADVNGDLKYDECDLCTSNAQCQARYQRTLQDCNIATPFTNPNDVDGDGVVDGNDIQVIGAGFFTAAYLDGKYHPGISARDAITMVSAGVPDNFLERHYISAPTETIGTECDVALLFGEESLRFVEWTNPMFVFVVGVVELAKSDEADHRVSWDIEGPFGKQDRVRVDLYEIFPSQGGTRYRHVRELAREVPALVRETDVQIGELPAQGEFVVVVTRQGGPGARPFSRVEQADWSTFGQSTRLGN